MSKGKGTNRRDFLKGIATLPVLGLYAYSLGKKISFSENNKKELIKEFKLKLQDQLFEEEKSSEGLIRIGMIGLGSRGQSLARSLGYPPISWIEEIPKKNKNSLSLESFFNQYDLNIQITGICDVFDVHTQEGLELAKTKITKDGISSLSHHVKRYNNYLEMVNSKDIDAVIIAAPDHLHAQIAIDAVKAGKNVYLEKCMTRTIDETIELYHIVKNSSVVFQLGHQNRQQESFYIAKEIFKKGLLGKVTLIEVASNRNTEHGAWNRAIHPKGNENTIDWKQFLGSHPYRAFDKDRYFNWQKYFDYGTGVCGQLFSHEFDALNQMMDLGIPKSASATGGIFYHKDGRDTPDIFSAIFDYPDKELTLTYNASLANSKNRGKLIMGSDGTLEVGSGLLMNADADSLQYKEEIEKGKLDISRPFLAYSPTSAEIDAITSATTKYYQDKGYGLTLRNGKWLYTTHLHLKDWLDCIRHGGTPRCDIEKGLEEAITCHMATVSYLEKRRVEWDMKNMRLV